MLRRTPLRQRRRRPLQKRRRRQETGPALALQPSDGRAGGRACAPPYSEGYKSCSYRVSAVLLSPLQHSGIAAVLVSALQHRATTFSTADSVISLEVNSESSHGQVAMPLHVS